MLPVQSGSAHNFAIESWPTRGVLFTIRHLLLVIGWLCAPLCLSTFSRADGQTPEARAFEVAQWATISAAGKAMEQLGQRSAAGSGDLSTIVRQRQDLLADIADKQRAADAADGDMALNASLLVALRGEIDSLRTEIAELDRRLAAEFPNYYELVNPKPLSILDVQAQLEDDEALLVFLVAAANTYVWAISKTASKWHEDIFGRAMLGDDIAILRAQLDPNSASNRGAESLDPEDGSATVPAFDRMRAWALYGELIRPVESVLLDKRHVFVVADGPLAALPLSVLVSEEPLGQDTDPSALRDTDWLAKRYAFTTLPTVSSLSIIKKAERTRLHSAKRFKGYGAPVLGGKRSPGGNSAERGFFRGSLANVEAVRDLAPLPQTEPELRRLAASLGAGEQDVFAGPRATEMAVKQTDFSNTAVLAFATHGLLSGDLQGLAEPALVLTPPDIASSLDDGLLTASEISELDLSAEWVILSACNTAGGDGRPDAEGLSGLARAFIYAGARAILVSHWPVRDDAAARLTTGAIGLLNSDNHLRRSEALAIAMLDLMRDGRDPSLAHPSAWAPFVVVGGGGY
jgi:CHAT domain-containing protein